MTKDYPIGPYLETTQSVESSFTHCHLFKQIIVAKSLCCLRLGQALLTMNSVARHGFTI
jgi:hypothetical protein